MSLTPEELEKKLKEARARDTARENRTHRAAGESENLMAQGFRMTVEFAAPVGIAAFLGYHLDNWLDSAPFGLFIMCLLGFGAGIMNVYRAAMGYGSTIGFKKKKKDED